MIILTIIIIISQRLVGHNFASTGICNLVVLAADDGVVVDVVRPAMTEDGYALVVFPNEV